MVNSCRDNKLLPWWKKWVYCNGLTTADNVTINSLFSLYFRDVLGRDTNILEFLACSNNYLHVISILKELMKPNTEYSFSSKREQNFKVIEYISMFHYIIKRHANNDLVLNYILTNWKEIKPKYMFFFINIFCLKS